jgi:hypothetical protein
MMVGKEVLRETGYVCTLVNVLANSRQRHDLRG